MAKRRTRSRKLKCLTLKVGYASRDEALAGIAGLLPHSRSGVLRAYRCPQCGAWHLTGQIPEVRDGRWRGTEAAVARG
jgi:hypothetical protein